MRRDSLSTPILIIGSALLLCSGAAHALGFGRVISASWLGQPLNFAAAVRLEADETLGRECVSAEVLSGDSRVPPAAIRLTVEPGADAGERLVRITTMTQIDEPVVTVTVSAGCNVRLTRSFVTLMDPPGLNLAQTNTPAPTLPPQRLESQVAPVVSVVQAEEAASAAPRPVPPPPRRAAAPVRPRAAPSTDVPVARVPRATAETARPPRERKAAAPRVAAARPAPGGPRLQLEAGTAAAVAASAAARTVETAAQTAATALPSASAPEVVAVAASAASAAEAAQQRVAALEENIEHLREESQKTQKALATLEATLKDAQSSRYSNPLVYGLAWLSALLAILAAALWWRQSHTRSASQWWLAPAAGSAGATPPVRPVVPRPPPTLETGGKVETEPAVMDDRATMRTLTDSQLPRKPAVDLSAPPTVVLADPPVLRRELSVEELIDLEQQADFFVVLGQDDAAIDLLMGHVRSSGGVSPLPYLKLLEIYRRRGEHESYDRIRERFNRRFSAYAPDWDADLAHGQALEDYPKILMQLQRLWDEPSRVIHMLDATLMRQDSSVETFDLPAYRELLFLYSIARDLAEHPTASGPVDLLLPLDGEVAEKPIEQLTASRLMGFASTDHATLTVDLDVTAALPPGSDPPASDFLGLVDPRLKDGSERG